MPVSIGAELQELPLGFLLGAPLKAAIEAQALAAKSTVEFITIVGLQEDPPDSGNFKVRTADFTYKHPVPDPANPGSFIEVETTLTVPILSIVPVPFIRISDLNVSFEFKIRDVQTASSKNEVTGSTGIHFTNEVNAKFGGGFFGFFGGPKGDMKTTTDIQINASTTYQATNRQTTDRSATFKMTMNAVQDLIPEGLARVLNILNDTIKAAGAGVPPTLAPPPAPT